MEGNTTYLESEDAAAAGSNADLWTVMAPVLILQVCQLVLSLVSKIKKSECCGGSIEFKSSNSVRETPRTADV